MAHEDTVAALRLLTMERAVARDQTEPFPTLTPDHPIDEAIRGLQITQQVAASIAVGNSPHPTPFLVCDDPFRFKDLGPITPAQEYVLPSCPFCKQFHPPSDCVRAHEDFSPARSWVAPLSIAGLIVGVAMLALWWASYTGRFSLF